MANIGGDWFDADSIVNYNNRPIQHKFNTATAIDYNWLTKYLTKIQMGGVKGLFCVNPTISTLQLTI